MSDSFGYCNNLVFFSPQSLPLLHIPHAEARKLAVRLKDVARILRTKINKPVSQAPENACSSADSLDVSALSSSTSTSALSATALSLPAASLSPPLPPRRLALRLSTDFAAVMRGVHAHHSPSWVSPELERIWHFMFARGTMVTFELWLRTPVAVPVPLPHSTPSDKSETSTDAVGASAFSEAEAASGYVSGSVPAAPSAAAQAAATYRWDDELIAADVGFPMGRSMYIATRFASRSHKTLAPVCSHLSAWPHALLLFHVCSWFLCVICDVFITGIHAVILVDARLARGWFRALGFGRHRFVAHDGVQTRGGNRAAAHARASKVFALVFVFLFMFTRRFGLRRCNARAHDIGFFHSRFNILLRFREIRAMPGAPQSLPIGTELVSALTPDHLLNVDAWAASPPSSAPATLSSKASGSASSASAAVKPKRAAGPRGGSQRPGKAAAPAPAAESSEANK